MYKPLKFAQPNPERRDPNFEAFEEKVKYKSKRELLYMCFLAVEALAVKDAAEKAAKEGPDAFKEAPQEAPKDGT